MNQEQRAELAAQVIEARNEKGWSQRRLAEEAGVSEGTITNLEKARRMTQPEKLRAILDALDIKPLATTINLEGVPQEVVLFLNAAAHQLKILDEDDRQRRINALYPILIGMGG